MVLNYTDSQAIVQATLEHYYHTGRLSRKGQQALVWRSNHFGYIMLGGTELSDAEQEEQYAIAATLRGEKW